MAKLNYSKCKKPNASYSSKRQLALKLKRRENLLATDKQKTFMTKLFIDFPKNISKKDASFLISKCLNKIEKTKKELTKQDFDFYHKFKNEK